MSSRYSQNRQLNGSGDLSRATARHHPAQLPRESMQAYDSHQQQGVVPMMPTVYQRVDRTRASGTESERKGLGGLQRDESSSTSRWLGRQSKSKSHSQDKGKFTLDKAIISPPMLAGTTAFQRPPRPPIEQTPASFYEFPTLEVSQTAPAPQPSRSSCEKPLPQTPQPSMHYPQQQWQPSVTKPPTIQPGRLGLRHEALGSHPVTTWLDGTTEKTPTARTLVPSATKEYNRCATVYPGSDESHIMLKEPQTSADLRAEKRRGRVYAPGELHELPDPSSWQRDDDTYGQGYFTNELIDDDYDSDSIWDDDTELEVRDPNIPTIKIDAPEDEPPQEIQPKKSHLHPRDAWKTLYEQRSHEMRGLKHGLLPLAWMIAEAGNVDTDDYREIQATLVDILNDRERLSNLLPLAVTLAKDQGLDVNDFYAMKPALRNVFTERDRAKDAATIHKRARHHLERRVRELESEMASMSMLMRATEYNDDDDDEEYIR
ncbi:hypothetical protein F5X99DRAFT_419991 [Biscogniauxia marginata]|nr:hypothetical protein F5X99DRAFT_419991 [Biscogniauxia marginata]